MAQKLSKKSKIAIKPVKTVPVKKGTLTMPKEFFSAVGRRKTAIARVRLWSGKQELTVNGKPISEYFKGESFKRIYQSPFLVTDTLSQFTGSIKVVGSGLMGQVGALVHGLSRTLVKIDEAHKLPLREKGFITRDPRMKETRKAGQGGRARAKKQSPKR
ncbi:MAG: 30S ribosomal protein S9 [Candidatus Collierbacteria bacterium GW2011_GWB1_45_35]|uniref:Small ribosomal subunit protein uS9 n=1 Tax=Candidatus Collierbacteria bacterium GW2011_GWB2_45_17 TaxID=1618388 RepID=A0A837IHZ4_9BACT|nr:MAG: 30S ribosomal protein S9 [Microgenomates group bacterium GW2011_GWC1_44_23]KKT96202.1 MAG: 30S ribosomal protein S9 [Candidatus Collierbacteria bacterium GW2011_GWA1_45_15]KKU01242.1 MAG: 30S ribosomal protein S9 [Candidatus Collierbacteria bacterium GW2011_GWB2_45_17]KKU05331.1 MAG: 30S ribosomal protein S9 [Candidatus Collierbacteria bacterium GW2011_GWB1_45_35]KKU08478.1 MAG: 30S ribosomal protein S9 [Candidatus Collierbacteria bacterium GW2011_GWC2_45_40]